MKFIAKITALSLFLISGTLAHSSNAKDSEKTYDFSNNPDKYPTLIQYSKIDLKNKSKPISWYTTQILKNIDTLKNLVDKTKKSIPSDLRWQFIGKLIDDTQNMLNELALLQDDADYALTESEKDLIASSNDEFAEFEQSLSKAVPRSTQDAMNRAKEYRIKTSSEKKDK